MERAQHIDRGPEATLQQDEEMAAFACAAVEWSILAATDTTSEGVKAHIKELYEKAGIKGREI